MGPTSQWYSRLEGEMESFDACQQVWFWQEEAEVITLGREVISSHDSLLQGMTWLILSPTPAPGGSCSEWMTLTPFNNTCLVGGGSPPEALGRDVRSCCIWLCTIDTRSISGLVVAIVTKVFFTFSSFNTISSCSSRAEEPKALMRPASEVLRNLLK